MGIEIKYKKDELVIKFTDTDWEVWKAICLFKNLYRGRWENQLTDRDRGFIDDIYSKMEKSGIDFSKVKAGVEVGNKNIKDTMTEIERDLKICIEYLKELKPEIKITIDKKLN